MLSDSVTHCIVGKNFVEPDVSAARELYDVTTVTSEWIRMSVLCNKLLPYPFIEFSLDFQIANTLNENINTKLYRLPNYK